MTEAPVLDRLDREALLQLSKEELIEIISIRAEASESVKAAASQALADISHHAARMASAMQTAKDEFEAAEAAYRAKWSALMEEIRRRRNGH
jgi:phage host-nuclease inhibitor protein Gam